MRPFQGWIGTSWRLLLFVHPFLFHISERHTECNTELWFEGRNGVGMGSELLGIACVYM